MSQIALSLLAIGAAFTQVHLSDPSKLALDMNVEIVTLLGIEHYAAPPGSVDMSQRERALARAQKAVDANPDDAANQLAYGQALEGLWRYHDAVQAYSNTISVALRDPAGYIRRGGGFIVLRGFEHAQTDLQRATELDPANFEAWYLRGLASYLQQDFEAALTALREAQSLASSEDAQIRTAYWVYLAARRLERDDEARATLTQARASADVTSARPYLTALLYFKDEVTSQQLDNAVEAGGHAGAIVGYASGLAQLFNGDQAQAVQRWRAIVESNEFWPAHAHIAAEAEIVAIEGVRKSLPRE